MQGKKRYLALILFLVIGLIGFTFANPNEELEPVESNVKKVSESENKTDAEKAVEQAELRPSTETVEEAEEIIEESVTNTEVRQELTQRLEVVEEAIDASELVATVERMVEESEDKDDILASEIYFNDNDIEVITGNMDPGDVKDNLEDRINTLIDIFEDEEAPTISGIEPGAVTKENVKITIEDTNEVTTTVTLNNKEIPFAEEFNEEGVYTINVVDAAHNPATITFTIDRTKPKFENLKSGGHYDSIDEIVVDDSTETTITIKNNDTNETGLSVPLNTDATYYITATDAAGNSKSVYVAIDTTIPEIISIDGLYSNKDVKVTIKDKFLQNVTINDKKYGRTDFAVGAKNENFSLEYDATKEGTYVIKATDKKGNSIEKTFTIDKTKPKFEGLASREVDIEYYKVDVTDDADTVITLQKDHGSWITIDEGYELTEEGTYQLKAVDAADNTYTTWIHIDKTAPEIYGIEKNLTNSCVSISAFDRYLNTVTIDGVKYSRKSPVPFVGNGQNENFTFTAPEAVCSEGEHVVIAVDKAGKTTEKTFTIDTTKPTGTATTSNKGGSTNKDVTVTIKTDEAIVTPEGWTIVTEGREFTKVFSDNIKQTLKIVDLAGNEGKVSFEVKRIDKVAPTATVTKSNNDDFTNEDVTVTIVSNEAIYKPSGWTEVKTNKEHEFTKVFSENGTYSVVIKDKAKNETTIEFEVKNIDKVPPKSISRNIYTNGVKEGTTYYAIKDNTITTYIRVSEQLKTIPTITFHVNGKDFVVPNVKESFHKAEDKENGIYKYEANVKLDDNFKIDDGALTFTISNIVDKAGNTLNDVSNATNNNKVIIDKTHIMLTQTSLSADAVKEKTYYVKNGDKITFNIGFNEMPVETPVVTIGGKKVELKYDKYYKAISTYLYRGSVTIQEGETELTEGELAIVISNVADKAGNKGFYYTKLSKDITEEATKYDTTNGRKVIYDITAPEAIASYEEINIEEDSVDEFTEFPTFTTSDNTGTKVTSELVSNTVNTHKTGSYELVYEFKDITGNITTKIITANIVDTKKPTFPNVEANKHYKSIKPIIDEKNLDRVSYKVTYLDEKISAVIPYDKDTTLDVYGTYELTATDKSGNTNSVKFVVDPIKPQILLLDQLKVIRGDLIPIKPVIIEPNIEKIEVTKDGQPYEYNQGDALTGDGEYVITVTDKAGNSTTSTFTMDNVAPIIVEPISGGVYQDVKVQMLEENMNEDAIVLLKKTRTETVAGIDIPIYEKVEYTYGDVIDEEGQYYVVVADKALNVSFAKFTIDRTPPTSNLIEGKVYNEVTPEIYEDNILVSEIMKEGRLLPIDYTEGDTIKEPGSYTLHVLDAALHEPLEVNFKVDGYNKPTITLENDTLESNTAEVYETLMSTTKINVRGIASDNITKYNEETKYVTPTITKYVNGVQEGEPYNSDELDVSAYGLSYDLTWKVLDEAGNEGTRTLKINVVNITHEIRFDETASYTSVYNGQEVAIPKTAKLYKIKQISENEIEETELNETINYSVDKTMKDAGTYTITAKYGNTTEKQQTYTITPKELVVTFENFANKKAVVNDTLESYKSLITLPTHYEGENEIFEYRMIKLSTNPFEINFNANKVDKTTGSIVTRKYMVVVSLKEENNYNVNYTIKDEVNLSKIKIGSREIDVAEYIGGEIRGIGITLD